MNSGKAIRQKIRDAIKAKLVDLGCYVDEELPDYIMVMLANKRSESQMTQDLDLFLNNNTITFTSWLFDLLRKLEQKPTKGEKKKKKKEKGSKHKSQKAEASSSSSSHQIEPEPQTDVPVQADNDDAQTGTAAQVTVETVDDAPPQPVEDTPVTTPPPPAGEASAAIISISLDTNDVLDKELTEEIDADRKKKAKQMAATAQRSPRSRKVSSPGQVKRVTSPTKVKKVKPAMEVVSDGASYREHVIKQRAARVEPISPNKPLEKLEVPTTTAGAAEPTTTTGAPQRIGVKLRLGERLVEEVIVDSESRKRKSPGSVVAQVIHHDSEEESDEEGPAKRVASSIRANRRPTLPTSRQANTALLKRAVSEAAASTSSVAEKQVPPTKPIAAQVKGNRPKIPGAPRPVTLRRIPQALVQKMRAPTLASITSSSDHGIQSRSLLREMKERDFDSQAFQTIEDQGNEEEIQGDYGSQEELVELVTSPPQKGIFIYKNVVAVVGETKAQQQQIIEEVPVISREEADSRQIYMAENVSVADSTQSPEHQYEEDEIVQEQEYEQEQGRAPKSVAQAGGANPRFVVTLEGAKKHLKLSANQRRKNQRRAIKRGFVQHPQQPAEEVFVVKHPRKAISPDVPRKFVFSEVRAPEEEVDEPMASDEGDERTAVLVEEPYMVYPSAQYQSAPYQPPSYPAPKVEPLTISMQDSDDDEGYEADDPRQDDSSTKSNERCKFWPACKNGDACPFSHPTTPCRTFPRCKFGDKCLYIHPNCRFDSSCTKANCPYTHATRKSVPPVVLQMTPPPARHPPLPRQGSQTVCKFHPLCKNPQCPFLHPRVCRFGKSCTRQGCTFFHPTIAVRSSLTWTKATKDEKTVLKPHISQRQFATPSAMSAQVPKSSPASSKVQKPALSKKPSPGK